MISLTFRQLEVFVEIVEHGGAAACAEKLGISQVSVNEHLKALEQNCGTVLLQRSRGVKGTLTDAGVQTYLIARQLVQKADALTSMYNGTRRDTTRRRIRFAAHEYIAERIGQRLASFVSAFPAIDLEQERRPFEGVIQGLSEGELEFAYFLSFGLVPEIESHCAWQEEVAFYVGENHPLAHREVVDPAELAVHPLISLPARTHFRRQFDALLESVGLDHVPNVVMGESHTFVLETLKKGHAIACLFELPTAPYLKLYGLTKVRLAFELPKMDVRCAVRSPFHHDMVIKQITSFLASSGDAGLEAISPAGE